jgi:hypothetical protein
MSVEIGVLCRMVAVVVAAVVVGGGWRRLGC